MPRPLRDVVDETGALIVSKLWSPTEKNRKIRKSRASNKLRVGGSGSGKSTDALMEVVQDYLLAYKGCNALYLRRNLTDLKRSSILDLHSIVPEELFDWNATTLVATFKATGSKLFFGHMENMNESDRAQYLSTAFPVIVVDECGQFSGEAWQFLQTRNRLNIECEPNDKGEYPKPVMLGCTNPTGPYWAYYKSVFIDKKPWNLNPEAKRTPDGVWWEKLNGKWEIVFNPADYTHEHSTVLDNPHQLAKDPNYVRNLMAQPEHIRKKYLYGELDDISGQFFDCWSPELHVIPEADIATHIIWQPWQPRWLGWDWGRVHHSAAVWMTYALVKLRPGGEFKQRIVVFREYVYKDLDSKDACGTIALFTRMGLPNASEEVRSKSNTLDAIYFSHEKFNRDIDPQSPAVRMSGYLAELRLPPARRATTNRVGRASLLYDSLKTNELVILGSCVQVIEAIPQLIRDDSNIEAVKKIDSKADDVYDGFTLGLYGQLRQNTTPDEVKLKEQLDQIKDPFWKQISQMKATLERDNTEIEASDKRPSWMRRQM